MRTNRLFGFVTAVALLAGGASIVRAQPAPAKADKRIILIAGGASHGFGAHDHKAGCYLLAKRINEIPGYEAAVYYKKWPDASAFDGANAVVVYADGGGGHVAIPHMKELDALSDKGVGVGFIHYAVEVPKGEAGESWLKWTGGYFEPNWSINPHWTADFNKLPQHPVANGVKPFKINDEWYYNMRFRPDMEGVTAILSAVPPETVKGSDAAHNGTPELHQRKGVSEHVMWVSENKNGSRGFGFCGGHDHANWVNDNFRKVVLNAILWSAKGEVPAGGVESKRPELDEMLLHHDENANDRAKEKLKGQVEKANEEK